MENRKPSFIKAWGDADDALSSDRRVNGGGSWLGLRFKVYRVYGKDGVACLLGWVHAVSQHTRNVESQLTVTKLDLSEIRGSYGW